MFYIDFANVLKLEALIPKGFSTLALRVEVLCRGSIDLCAARMKTPMPKLVSVSWPIIVLSALCTRRANFLAM